MNMRIDNIDWDREKGKFVSIRKPKRDIIEDVFRNEKVKFFMDKVDAIIQKEYEGASTETQEAVLRVREKIKALVK